MLGPCWPLAPTPDPSTVDLNQEPGGDASWFCPNPVEAATGDVCEQTWFQANLRAPVASLGAWVLASGLSQLLAAGPRPALPDQTARPDCGWPFPMVPPVPAPPGVWGLSVKGLATPELPEGTPFVSGEAPAWPGLGVISCLLGPRLCRPLGQTSLFPGLGVTDP